MRGRVFAVLVATCVSTSVHGQSGVEITLKQDSKGEAQTREQLQRLLTRYDRSPWIVTTKISIDETAIPHSHPILMLHTRHAQDDELLLSTFAHEQFHWFLAQREQGTADAIKELRAMF